VSIQEDARAKAESWEVRRKVLQVGLAKRYMICWGEGQHAGGGGGEEERRGRREGGGRGRERRRESETERGGYKHSARTLVTLRGHVVIFLTVQGCGLEGIVLNI
jgi:hypothetical protein